MSKLIAFSLTTLLAVFAANPAAAQQPTVQFGSGFGVALRSNGDVLTWGNNVFCQLGRPSPGNTAATPTLVMRNVKEIAVASQHGFALTQDGKVYAWGTNPKGVLGVGHQWELCEGPEVVTSLADVTVSHIGTGYAFAVAVSATGDLYCSGENDNLQCPVPKGAPANAFVRLPIAEFDHNVASISAGTFHTLVQTKDGKVYAFGRGRDGQLGPGPTANGFRPIPELTDVVSLSAGTWHSAALTADGSVWLWGNDSKSQLCDGMTTNRTTPTKVTLPGDVKATQVIASGLTTMIRSADGTVYGCGDNQAGLLGIGQPIAARPTLLPIPGGRAKLLAMSGGNSAASSDGCAIQLAGANDGSIVRESAGSNGPEREFVARTNLTLCAAKASVPVANLVREYPKGGESGCWTPRVEEDGAKSPKFAGQVQAMIAAESILKKNAAFMAPPAPSRFRTSLSAGPYNESGARMHIKIVPERKPDLTRLWTGTCDVIPQIDRIGGAIYQISVFFNNPFASQTGELPKQTGTVGGYPEYDHWVYITKDGGLPWIPQTLAERLDAIGEKRATALADWTRERANEKAPSVSAAQPGYELLKKTDPEGAEKFLATMRDVAEEFKRRQQMVHPAEKAELEKQIADFKSYRSSFTTEQLASAAVLGDPSGQLKRESDQKAAALRALDPSEQAQIDAWAVEGRAFERQAQLEMKNRNTSEVTRLRTLANELAQKGRDLRARHSERIAPAIADLSAQYELANLRPGPAEQAIRVKANPALPNLADPNRIQVIAVYFGEFPVKDERTAWRTSIRDNFDFSALAALLK